MSRYFRIQSVRPAGCFFLAALFFFSQSAAWGSDDASLRILHVNDLHGWLLPGPDDVDGNRPAGGLARMAALVAELKTEATIFVAAGDLMSGTNVSNLFQGRPVTESLDVMDLQATAVGNHEFDYGLPALAARAKEASFPFLAANIEGPGGVFFEKSLLLEVDGLKVGLFGLTTVETPWVTHPRNVEALSFTDPAAAAKKVLANLRRDADLIVCLSHLGLGGDIRLAESVPGIDVIVGGHTHTKLAEPLKIKETIILQAYERGVYVGVLDLFFQDGKVGSFSGRLAAVDGRAGEERTVAAIVERYRLRAGEKFDVVIGRAAGPFDGSRKNVRTGETNLGSLAADVVKDAAGADGAIVNGGSIRAGIPAGAVTLAHIFNAFPFDSYVLAFVLSGREVRQALETGLSRLEDQGGGFPQVAGFSYTFDPLRPPGSRLRSVMIGGRNLDDDGRYVVATSDFLAAGGDGFRVFIDKKPVYANEGTFVRDLVVRYWQNRGELSRPLSGRIGIVR